MTRQAHRARSHGGRWVLLLLPGLAARLPTRQLVGRSRFCNRPAEVRSLPEVGGHADPSLEAILGQAPTLVIGAYGPAGQSISEQLESHGVHTFFGGACPVAAQRFSPLAFVTRHTSRRSGGTTSE